MSERPGSPTQPLWAEEFSVHAAEDAYVLRRQFTKFLVLASAGMFAGQAWIWARSLVARRAPALPRVPVARASDLKAGSVALFSYPGPNDPCIMVRKPDGVLAAFSQKCTHLSCSVYYSRDTGHLECPCHEGRFSIEDGRVLAGPPPRPLPRIDIEERDGQLFAVGVRTEAAS